MENLNPILADYLSKIPHYCHVVEVESAYELQSIIEELFNSFSDIYSQEHVLEFISSLTVYSLDDDNEDEIYEFNITEFLNTLI